SPRPAPEALRRGDRHAEAPRRPGPAAEAPAAVRAGVPARAGPDAGPGGVRALRRSGRCAGRFGRLRPGDGRRALPRLPAGPAARRDALRPDAGGDPGAGVARPGVARVGPRRRGPGAGPRDARRRHLPPAREAAPTLALPGSLIGWREPTRDFPCSAP